MPTTNLTNITIQQKEDKNFNKYYLIVDNDTDQAYFCFEKAVKMDELIYVNNWQGIKEVELEFEVNDRGNKKVVSIYVESGIIV